MCPRHSLAVGLALICVAPAAAQPYPYTITDLGLMGGTSARGVALNNNGVAVAIKTVTAGGYHSFTWAAGTTTDLGTLGGPSAFAMGMNDAGQVVGQSFNSAGNEHPFLYTAGSGMVDLGTYTGGTGYAAGISPSGVALGAVTNGLSGFQHATSWSGGVRTDLGLPPGMDTSRGVAMNAAGTILVDATDPSNNEQGFILQSGAWTNLGTLGGAITRPFAINASGDVVGRSTLASGGYAPFVWHAGVMTELPAVIGPFPGEADAINSLGVILGRAENTLLLWEGTTQINLATQIDPAAGWSLAVADAINDSGQLLVDAKTPAGVMHAILLTPVPEPSTLALTGFAAAALAYRRVRRRSA
jgi:probable HAF family extracellular repeat protein